MMLRRLKQFSHRSLSCIFGVRVEHKLFPLTFLIKRNRTGMQHISERHASKSFLLTSTYHVHLPPSSLLLSGACTKVRIVFWTCPLPFSVGEMRIAIRKRVTVSFCSKTNGCRQLAQLQFGNIYSAVKLITCNWQVWNDAFLLFTKNLMRRVQAKNMHLPVHSVVLRCTH